MRTRIAPLLGLLGGLLLALVATATVFAYAGQVSATVEASGPSGEIACNTPITITARVQDMKGVAIEGQSAVWSFMSGDMAGDKILETNTIANSSGVATTQVVLGCAPRYVWIQVQADDAYGTLGLEIEGLAEPSAGAVEGVVAPGPAAGPALPQTDTAPESSLPALALAALAVVIGSGTILRRVSTRRR